MAFTVYGTEWTEQLIDKLSTYNLKVRGLCQKANFELKNIIAMDETAVWNDMISNTTVEETGAQTVNREITHPNDNANDNGKTSSSIVIRSTPWGYPFKSRMLKFVTHIIMCAAFYMGEYHDVTILAHYFQNCNRINIMFRETLTCKPYVCYLARYILVPRGPEIEIDS